MTDLQCAARVFVARHGEALYERELLSDAGGWLSPLGREQALELAEPLSRERIARVWTSDMARAVQTGEIVAGQLGVDVVVRKGLREFGVGDAAGRPVTPTRSPRRSPHGSPATSTPGSPARRAATRSSGATRAVLDEVADEHRGESVLVVSHGGVMCMALSALARNLALGHSRDLPMPHGGVVALEADADGWVARSWAGTTL